MRYIGVDGCRAGWFSVALSPRGSWAVGVDQTVAAILDRYREAEHVLVDIPIGLPADSEPRACDVEARRILKPRGSTVFPAPSRASLTASSYDEASRINQEVTGRKLTRQSWAIAPKIKEVDDLLRSDPLARRLMREVHPEVLFCKLNGSPMAVSKKRVAGRDERFAVLQRFFPAARDVLERAATTIRPDLFEKDDVIDAMVAAVVARIGRLQTIPRNPPVDEHGLPMEMVYAEDRHSA